MPKVLAQNSFLEFFVGLHNKSLMLHNLCSTETVSVRVFKNDLEELWMKISSNGSKYSGKILSVDDMPWRFSKTPGRKF